MENENEPIVDEVPEIEEELDESGNDTTDWKEQTLKNQGIAKRFKTQKEKITKEFDEYKKTHPDIKPEAKPEMSEKPNELDYELNSGDKALLFAYHGIKGADELAFTKSWLKRTGDDIDATNSDDIFKARLQSLRDAKASKEALPTAQKRGQQTSPKDSPEYWLDKPINEVPENLKRDVVNARIKHETEGTKFSSQPVVEQKVIQA